MRSYVTQVAVRGKSSPLLCGWVLQTVFPVKSNSLSQKGSPRVYEKAESVEPRWQTPANARLSLSQSHAA
jgi:hypothetical protein